jgi:hypothetical protein
MKRRSFVQGILSASVAPYVARTFGSPESRAAPKIELDINGNSWSAGWPATKRVNMEYSNAHQETNGRQLEFAFAQHSRRAGDHTSVRWTDFATNGPPTQGYYWPEDDVNIQETDNLPTLYKPDSQQIFLIGIKIIDIKSPAALFRNADGSGVSFTDKVEIALLNGASDAMWRSNYNPACLVNPDDNCPPVYFGGGYWTNYSGGRPPSIKILTSNPDYPRRSDKPWLLTVKVYGTAHTPFPIYTRHAVKIGDWIYWGGGGVSDDLKRTREFYRIQVPSLYGKAGTVIQERVSDLPGQAGMPGSRFSLNCADVAQKKLIHVNGEGVWRYHVPKNDGADGIWEGPHTFGIANWPTTISDGRANGTRGDWHGFIGTHRSDLNQTFFRYNLSKRWNRLRWPSPPSG